MKYSRYRALFTLLVTISLCPHPAAAQSEHPSHKIAEGTGFYISHDGYLLTANHVVAHCSDDISAHNEQMVLKVQLLAQNPDKDLALLKIIPLLTIEHIATMRSVRQPLQPSEKLVVAGYPESTTDINKEFVAFSTNDAVLKNTTTMRSKDNWIQFTYSARFGFSGGPVLDSYGNIVGLTSGGTCASATCIGPFKAAMAKLKSAKTMDEIKVADAEVAANTDTNIAASQSSIRQFLSENGIAMEEKDFAEFPDQQRLKAIADSIVNLRCTQNDDDFNHSTRVLNIR